MITRSDIERERQQLASESKNLDVEVRRLLTLEEKFGKSTIEERLRITGRRIQILDRLDELKKVEKAWFG